MQQDLDGAVGRIAQHLDRSRSAVPVLQGANEVAHPPPEEVDMVDMRNIRQLAEKKTWTEEDGRKIVAAWRASGQTIAAFAKTHGIGDGRLRWWRDRVRGASGGGVMSRLGPPVEGPRLVRVEVDESDARRAPATSAWELVTSRGHLRVQHEGIGVGELRLVLEALVSKGVVP
jgi:transposase-like protein